MKDSGKSHQYPKHISFHAPLIFFLMPKSCTALSSSGATPRRRWINKAITTASSAAMLETFIESPTSASAEVDVLPSELRRYTTLAPLGTPTATGQKSINLSLQEIADRLSNDLTKGATGKGGYFISGDLSTELFQDDCVFIDPTNSVSSLSRYQNALKILFDPKESYVRLISMTIDESRSEIKARIESGGVLQLPWKPRISTYQSDIVYKIDDDGLIESQIQNWSISASRALVETFTPPFLKSQHSTIHTQR